MRINSDHRTIALKPDELVSIAQFDSGDIGALAIAKMCNAVVEQKDQTVQTLQSTAAEPYFDRRTKRRLKQVSKKVGTLSLADPAVVAQAYTFTPEYVNNSLLDAGEEPSCTYDFPLTQTAPILHAMFTADMVSCEAAATRERQKADYFSSLAQEKAMSGYDRVAETAAFSAKSWQKIAEDYLRQAAQLAPFLQ